VGILPLNPFLSVAAEHIHCAFSSLHQWLLSFNTHSNPVGLACMESTVTQAGSVQFGSKFGLSTALRFSGSDSRASACPTSSCSRETLSGYMCISLFRAGRNEARSRPGQEACLALHVLNWGLSEANALKYLRRCWEFLAPPPQWFGARGIVHPGKLCYGPGFVHSWCVLWGDFYSWFDAMHLFANSLTVNKVACKHTSRQLVAASGRTGWTL